MQVTGQKGNVTEMPEDEMGGEGEGSGDYEGSDNGMEYGDEGDYGEGEDGMGEGGKDCWWDEAEDGEKRRCAREDTVGERFNPDHCTAWKEQGWVDLFQTQTCLSQDVPRGSLLWLDAEELFHHLQRLLRRPQQGLSALGRAGVGKTVISTCTSTSYAVLVEWTAYYTVVRVQWT